MSEAFSDRTRMLAVGICVAVSASCGRTGLQPRQPDGGQPSHAVHDSGNGLPDAVPSPFRCLSTAFDIPTPNSDPAQIVTGPDGALWLRNSAATRSAESHPTEPSRNSRFLV